MLTFIAAWLSAFINVFWVSLGTFRSRCACEIWCCMLRCEAAMLRRRECPRVLPCLASKQVITRRTTSDCRLTGRRRDERCRSFISETLRRSCFEIKADSETIRHMRVLKHVGSTRRHRQTDRQANERTDGQVTTYRVTLVTGRETLTFSSADVTSSMSWWCGCQRTMTNCFLLCGRPTVTAPARKTEEYYIQPAFHPVYRYCDDHWQLPLMSRMLRYGD